MRKCPSCGYHAVYYNPDNDRFECYDCGWHN